MTRCTLAAPVCLEFCILVSCPTCMPRGPKNRVLDGQTTSSPKSGLRGRDEPRLCHGGTTACVERGWGPFPFLFRRDDRGRRALFRWRPAHHDHLWKMSWYKCQQPTKNVKLLVSGNVKKYWGCRRLCPGALGRSEDLGELGGTQIRSDLVWIP